MTTTALPDESGYRFREQAEGIVAGPVDEVFAYLDGHARLAKHMERPSWRMGWGRMAVHLDTGEGRTIGSHIRIDGRVLGIDLAVDEVITTRQPPRQKWWETVGEPHLLVIGRYRMGFTLDREASGTRLVVKILYDLPATGVARLLGRLFGGWYARWCTRQMVRDAQAAFTHDALALQPA